MEISFPTKNQTMLLLLLVLITSSSMFISPCFSYDPKNPPKPVKEVCHRSGKQYWHCISVFNTGSVANADMRFLAYYTRDFAENNATDTINRINTTLIPSQPDPYVHQVLNVCMDAFTRLKDELANRVNPMIVSKDEFEEAKAWVNYGMGLVSSCREVCVAKPHMACPLTKNIDDTHNMLKLLSIVLELLTEGVM